MIKTKDYLVVDCHDLEELIVDKYKPKMQKWIGDGEGFSDGWEGVIKDFLDRIFLPGNGSYTIVEYIPDNELKAWREDCEPTKTDEWIQQLYREGEIPKDKPIFVKVWW